LRRLKVPYSQLRGLPITTCFFISCRVLEPLLVTVIVVMS